MKKKIKKILKESMMILGITFIIGSILCRPIIKEFFKENYYVVVDDISAQQEINHQTEDIEVEFRCSENEFSKLLTNFKNAHKGLIEIDTNIEDETPFFDKEESTKSFIVRFSRWVSWWLFFIQKFLHFL